jgi:hypothetical protein
VSWSKKSLKGLNARAKLTANLNCLETLPRPSIKRGNVRLATTPSSGAELCGFAKRNDFFDADIYCHDEFLRRQSNFMVDILRNTRLEKDLGTD